MKRLGLALLLPLLLVASAACKTEDKPVVYRELTDDDLRAMVLKVEDLPPGYTLSTEVLVNNEEFAKAFENTETVRGLVDSWGRAGGLENQFANTDAPDKPFQPLRVASAVSRYTDVLKAKDAWKGRNELDQHLKVQPAAIKTLDNPRIGDQSETRRWYVTDEQGRDLVVYSVSFRKGTVLGNVTTTALKNKDDRGKHAIQYTKLLNERTGRQLK